ncbi:MAG: MBL fold metallo-hydrolase, partial [Lachnospiraceae bacterium]|nr:MBL fold metallo-hydrolase [Lachnospiraceae bacterium]
MRTEKITDNIYRIPVGLPKNPLKELNSYFITGDEHPLLIDTGFRRPECTADLIAGIEELGYKASDVDIFITHFHADHLGNAPDIIGPGRKLYLNAVELPWVNDFTNREKMWEENSERFIWMGATPEVIYAFSNANPAKAFSPVKPSENYVPVYDGDVIKAGPYELNCVQTPGHTPGHMCLWEEKSGIMFSGDHVLFDITPNITAWAMMEDSLGSYIESLKMIDKYPVRMTLPGHRKTGDFHARVAALLKH